MKFKKEKRGEMVTYFIITSILFTIQISLILFRRKNDLRTQIFIAFALLFLVMASLEVW